MANDRQVLQNNFHLSQLKGYSLQQLNQLCDEIRSFILHSVSQTGGHLGSNLGVVELTVALHTVFNSPKDRIIFDVGHQCYTHKILTGRMDGFVKLRKKGGLSGFTRRDESSHDTVSSGHASVAMSVGLGLLMGQDLQDQRAHVVCVVGDAALSGGVAFEALNNIGMLQKPLIIVLNDNQMSISAGVGALHQHLEGQVLTPETASAFFETLGISYQGPVNGHDITVLRAHFEAAMQATGPVVVHVCTQKGYGYVPAMEDPKLYHGVEAFNVGTGLVARGKKSAKSLTDIFSIALVKAAKKDDKICAITAAMMTGAGLEAFAETFPTRFFDVGIAEQHAVAFGAGLSASGLKPVITLYSTFSQRAVDQVIHDLVQQQLFAVIVMDRAGLVPGDGSSHQGIYDIALFQSLPDTIFLAPATGEELGLMLKWALRQKKLVFMRYAKAVAPPAIEVCKHAIVSGSGVHLVKSTGSVVLIITLGILADEVLQAQIQLATQGLQADVYNMRFVSPINRDNLEKVVKGYSLVATVEEAVVDGGWGMRVQSIVSAFRSAPRVISLGVTGGTPPVGTRADLLKHCGLNAAGLAKQIKQGYTEAQRQAQVEQMIAQSRWDSSE